MLTRLLLFLSLLVITLPVSASGDAIEDALDQCNQVESPLDVPTGCEAHVNCLFNSANVNCTETTLVQLAQSCDGFGYRQCIDIATLTTIAIDDAILGFQAMDTTTQLNNSLNAFISGDYQTAIDLYENVTLSLDYFPHYILELGLGILYLRFDNPDVALIQFDKSLNLEFYNPVAFYYRGNTYEERANSVRALRDHYMYDLLADPQLKVTLPLRSFRIQIPDSELQTLYAVYTLEQGVDSFRLQDDTSAESQSIVVSLLDNDETLVIADWLDVVAGDETEILFLERDSENPLRYILNINQQDIPDSISSGKTEISVIVSPTILELYLRSTQGPDTTLVTSIANIPPEPDIRQDSPARVCELAPLSLLEDDQTVVPLPPETQLFVVDDPLLDNGIAVDVKEADGVPIIDGPVCYDNRIWWQVSTSDVTGWVTENSSLPTNQYRVMAKEQLTLWQTNPPSPLQFLRLLTVPESD